MIYESILDVVGRTPVVRLSRLFRDFSGRVYFKLEHLNPGGSHKVRIAISMIRDAEENGNLALRGGRRKRIVEPTGGNTGLGLAMACAILGYKLTLVIPDNYSKSKQALLRAFGAKVELSDSRQGNNSHGELAASMVAFEPENWLLNQQANPANPAAHTKSTVQEILDDFKDLDLDVFIGGIGTGGHVTAIGKALKDRYENLKVFGVEPEGCDLLKSKFIPHSIQGLAVGLVPKNLDITVIDEMLSVTLEDCVEMMKQLMRVEGIAVGLSSAANVVCARRLIERSEKPINILALSYDSAADYLEHLINDEE
jgi:cysteine synthase A